MGIILVTGGTGFVGAEVVRQLVQTGHRVRVLVRRPEVMAEKMKKLGVEMAVGDVLQPETLQGALRGVFAVVHLVGIIHERPQCGVTFPRLHRDATRNVVNAAAAAGVKRYLHMSALGTRRYARARYHQSKWEAEEIVRGSALAWTIFRPSVIFGPGDGFVNQFVWFLKFPVNLLQLYTFPRPGGGVTQFQPIPVTDVAQAFIRAVSQPETVRQTYDLCGRERITLTEILQEITAATGQRATVEKQPFQLVARHAVWAGCFWLPLAIAYFLIRGILPKEADSGLMIIWLILVTWAARWRTIILFPMPWAAAYAAGAVLQRLPLPVPPPLTFDQVIMLQEDNIGQAEPAATQFDLALTSLRAGLREYVRR